MGDYICMRGASTLSQYFWPVRLPSRTYKSNLQSKEKQPQTVTPPPPKAVVPKMWLSWNEVFRWHQTLAQFRKSSIYTVRQKLSTTWLVSIISFLIMNLFQIGLLFSLPVHTYLLTCETVYWSIFIYVYITGCVKCHVYFSTFVFANESWFFFVEF
jgi:hypothetical protein